MTHTRELMCLFLPWFFEYSMNESVYGLIDYFITVAHQHGYNLIKIQTIAPIDDKYTQLVHKRLFFLMRYIEIAIRNKNYVQKIHIKGNIIRHCPTGEIIGNLGGFFLLAKSM